MRIVFLLFLFISAPAFADRCDTGLLQCITYAPDKSGECYALTAQCKQQQAMVQQLQQMNEPMIEDQDSMAAVLERSRQRRR